MMLEERGSWIQEERKMENIKRVQGRMIDSISGGTGDDDDLENLRLGVRDKLVRKGVLESVKESGQEVCEEEFKVTVRNIRQEAAKVIEEARKPRNEEDSKRMGEGGSKMIEPDTTFNLKTERIKLKQQGDDSFMHGDMDTDNVRKIICGSITIQKWAAWYAGEH